MVVGGEAGRKAKCFHFLKVFFQVVGLKAKKVKFRFYFFQIFAGEALFDFGRAIEKSLGLFGKFSGRKKDEKEGKEEKAKKRGENEGSNF